MKKKLLSFFTSIVTALLILSGSIALPILIRPFYYAHIKPLNLEQISGKGYNAIVNAYNSMLNYCTGLTNKFSLGEFAFSDEGAEHFKDVRKLFILDITVFLLCAIILAALIIVLKHKKIKLYRPLNFSPQFFSAVFILGLFLVLGGLVSLNFTAAFEIFHKIFFAGKTNWTFDILTDPIILVLPEVFFRNCAIFIFLNLIVSCASIIIIDIIKRKKRA